MAGSHEPAPRKRTLGSTCRWKALWAEEAAPFDEDAGESVLGAPGGVWSRPGRARRATESVRGRSPASHAVDNAAAKWRRKFAVALERAPAMESASSGRMGRSSRRAVKRALPGAGSPKGGLAPLPKRAHARSSEVVGEAKAPRTGARRSTGARVVSRLQKSVRSIFLARSRGAERRTEKTRCSTTRRSRPDGARPPRVG